MRGAPGSPDEWIDLAGNDGGLADERVDGLVVEIITRFPADIISSVVLRRIRRINGPEGVLLLRLIEALARRELYDALADALVVNPDLDPSRLVEAIEILEGTGCIEARPALIELRSDLDELYDEDATIEEFAAQIEGDPEEMGLILETLFLMDVEDRDEILAALSRLTNGVVVGEFLRRARGRLEAPG